jgi:hypothetical protein
MALLAATSLGWAQTNADAWYTNAIPLPVSGITTMPLFESLRADVVSGQLQITWNAAKTSVDNAAAVIFASADPIGHWPARDWRSHRMHRHGTVWQANIPVETLDVPVAYFAVFRSEGATNISPTRICRPRRLGLEQPSKLHWPFVEGFEQGLESWRNIAGTDSLKTTETAKNGRNALSLRIARDKHSASVGTTRLRGWSIEERGAIGIAFWARTRSGTGHVRVTLLANAFTTNQLTSAQTTTFRLTSTWNRHQVPFADHPASLIGDLDLVVFECVGAPETEFLIDDLYLLGRWRFD